MVTQRTHDKPARLRGFTIVEMMVTVSVAAVLLAVAAPSFRELIVNQRIKTASFDLYSAMNFARSEALKRNTPISLKAGATTGGAWTTGWRVDDGTSILRSWGGLSYLSVNQPAGSTTVTFGTDGRLTTAAPKIEIVSTASLTGITARCIQVDLSGRPTTSTGSCP